MSDCQYADAEFAKRKTRSGRIYAECQQILWPQGPAAETFSEQLRIAIERDEILHGPSHASHQSLKRLSELSAPTSTVDESLQLQCNSSTLNRLSELPCVPSALPLSLNRLLELPCAPSSPPLIIPDPNVGLPLTLLKTKTAIMHRSCSPCADMTKTLIDVRQSMPPSVSTTVSTGLITQVQAGAHGIKRTAGDDVSRQHFKRRLRRGQDGCSGAYVPATHTVSSVLKSATSPSLQPLVLEKLPAAKGAYCALNNPEPRTLACTLTEAQAMGLSVLSWDGRNPMPLVADGKVFMVLAGRPNDPSYEASAEEAFNTMQTAYSEGCFAPKDCSTTRGLPCVLNVGVTRGMGSPAPLNRLTHEHAHTAQQLLQHPAIQRIASYASSAFAIWAPRTYNLYKKTLDLVFGHQPELRRIFPKSIFPAATFNFGPKAVCTPHFDVQNCPFGWCAITALGHFDPKKGGHLIIWKLKLAVEFPPGSTILLPSAVLEHSNTGIAEHESRASFTQYCSGGLFRWADYGCQAVKDVKVSQPDIYHAQLQLQPGRWRERLNLLSSLDELKSGQAFK